MRKKTNATAATALAIAALVCQSTYSYASVLKNNQDIGFGNETDEEKSKLFYQAAKKRKNTLSGANGKESKLLDSSGIRVVKTLIENYKEIEEGFEDLQDAWLENEHLTDEMEEYDEENDEWEEEEYDEEAGVEYFGVDETDEYYEIDEHEDDESNKYEEDNHYEDYRKLSSNQRRKLSSQTRLVPNTLEGQCNEFVHKKKCTSFRSFLENNVDAENEMVVVPCGVCLKVDIYSGRTVELPHGLNVIGRLQFTSLSRVVIRTTAVIVQGLLGASPPKYAGKNAPIPLDKRQVKIVLYGDKEISFIPDGKNREACGLNAETNEPVPCNVGMKPFAVAGGRVEINRMLNSCPPYAKLVDVVTSPSRRLQAGEPNRLILSDPMAAKCWGQGARVVVASDTFEPHNFQEATIQHLNATTGVITLNEPLEYIPTTAKQNPLYAVEVHLDNRNFIIESEPTDTIGGHFIVYHTPGVKQMIKGVEFRKMGQQGILGRYPVHFHMSENCLGSVVSRNLIRDSFQRCVVIHGTHNVTIQHNVAFNTFGHCFMTEDGGEYDNKFEYNLGHLTKKMPQDKLLSKDASDHNAATFWWTNPMNTFIGNIAAGSEAHGIWFELHGSVRGPAKHLAINRGKTPRKLPLGVCRDNVSHSNRKQGFTTYKTGMIPFRQAVFENQVSFRNGFSGMFIHKSQNLKILGGHFADNMDGIRVLQADNIEIDGPTFVALSKTHHDSLQKRNMKLWSNCRNPDKSLTAVTWTPTQEAFTGTTIVNAKFEEYDNKACQSFAIEAERMFLDVKSHISTVNFSNLTFSSPSNRVSVCRAQRVSVVNMAIEDFDGSIGGTGSPGFVVQENLPTANLLDTKCNPLPGARSCMKHCPNACLRNLHVKTPGTPNLSRYIMKITDTDGREALLRTGLTGDGMTSHKEVVFGAFIPSEDVTISFLDRDGNAVWPGYARPSFETSPTCEHNITLENISFDKPPSDRPACDELIYNGDFESKGVEGWLADRCAIKVLSVGAIGSKRGLKTQGNRDRALIRQVLDQSCLVNSGLQDYVIKGSFRLVDGKGRDTTCDLNAGTRSSVGCPQLHLKAGKLQVKPFKMQPQFTDGTWTDFSYSMTLPTYFESNERVHVDISGAPSNEYYLDNFSIRKASYGGNHFVPISAHGMYANDLGRHQTTLEENRGAFDQLLRDSPHKIVKRFCMHCKASHMTIFYRRWTSHAGVPLLEYFENSFTEVNNKFNEDFSLYSTYEDAVADTNRWTHCTFSNNQGFPSGCGPSEISTGQFNAYDFAGSAQKNVIFSVEAAGSAGTPARRSLRASLLKA